MLTFVFLFALVVFAIAAIAISLSARKGRAGQKLRQMHPSNDSPTVGRANSDED